MQSSERTDGLSTGDLARASGVGVQTLRYYERRGILPCPERRGSTQRRYEPEAVQLVRFVKRAQALGFSLEEIQELLDLRSVPDLRCATVQARVRHKLGEIEARIHDLEAMRDTLGELALRCTGQEPVRECVILQAFERSDAAQSRRETPVPQSERG